MKRVFPHLRKLCESRGVTWGEVDLRWGITDEQKAEGKVLPVCLAEIHRCRPYFIGLLGERYGWVPDQIPTELEAQEPWLTEHQGRSVTELEILHGVLRNPAMANHAFFYFRSPSHLETLPADERRSYREGASPEEIERFGREGAEERAEGRRAKLVALKERIRATGFPVREDYPDPKVLGELVLADLTGVIDRLYPEGSEPDPLDREAAEHEAFARSRAAVSVDGQEYGVYIGRDEYFERLDEHVRGDGPPLVVLGESGSGKSALLANWAFRYRKGLAGNSVRDDEFLLLHFIGASPASADWAAMVRRILGEIRRRLGVDVEVPDKPQELRATVANALHMAAAKGRVVLILDALNQLEDRDQAPELVWLPPVIPENVRLILSTLPGRPLKDLARRGWPTLEVQPLEPEERRELIVRYLKQYTKELPDLQVEHIASAPQAANPLFVRALLEELRLWGEHETLKQRIEHYLSARSVEQLYEKILARYEEDYERERPGLVRELMSLLWASRRGLSEPELLDLLGRDGEPLPQARWSPLYLSAEQSLITRGGLIGFAHNYLRRATEVRYLASVDGQHAVHKRLAEYFKERRLGHRVFDELPWQLTRAEDWDALRSLVTDPHFMEALFDFNASEYSNFVLLLLDRTSTDIGLLYRDFLRSPKNFPVQTLTIIHNLLRVSGSLDLAETFSRDVVQNAEELGDPEAVGKALLLAIGSQKAQGIYDYEALLSKAEAIFRELGDWENLARCLAHRADFHKYHRRDLRAAIKYHQEQETILRQTGNLSSLVTCLNNQAVTYGRLMEPEKELALRLEIQNICRELGDMDSTALSECNLGVFHLQAARIQRKYLGSTPLGWGAPKDDLNEAGLFLLQFGNVHDNLRTGWMLLESAESRYRALLKPHSLAGLLRLQVEAIWDLVQSPFSEELAEVTEVIARVALPKAQEARDLYLKFGTWRRNEVEYMAKLIDGMIHWVDSTRNTQMLGLAAGSLATALGLAEDEQELSEEDINREFALFVLDQGRRQEAKNEGGLGSMRIIVKVVKEVRGQKLWEIENCPASAYAELDQLGVIPEMGIVSRPGNTAIVPGREGEVFAYLEKQGLAFDKLES